MSRLENLNIAQWKKRDRKITSFLNRACAVYILFIIMAASMAVCLGMKVKQDIYIQLEGYELDRSVTNSFNASIPAKIADTCNSENSCSLKFYSKGTVVEVPLSAASVSKEAKVHMTLTQNVQGDIDEVRLVYGSTTLVRSWVQNLLSGSKIIKRIL